MRIAVYSGSFDPVHNGHVALTRYVAMLPEVDEVWLLVTPHNPLKPLATSATFEQRMEMTRLAVAGLSGVRVMDFEAQLPPPHFTYSTLCALRARFPEHSFSLLIGSDNWHIFPSWRNHNEIIREFGLLVYPRPGYETDSATFPPQVRFLADAPTSTEASTDIRAALATSPLPNNSIPADVYTYINTHRLYGRNQDKP